MVRPFGKFGSSTSLYAEFFVFGFQNSFKHKFKKKRVKSVFIFHMSSPGMQSDRELAAPHFDKQNEDGVRSTLFPLGQLGKDVYSQIWCCYVSMYANMFRMEDVILKWQMHEFETVLSSLICDCTTCLHGTVGIRNGINGPFITCHMLLIVFYDCIIMLLSRISKACKSKRNAPFVQSVYVLTQNFQ